MLRHNQPKIRLLSPTLDRSPTPTTVNTEICKDELSIVVEAIKKKLQTSKEMPAPNL